MSVKKQFMTAAAVLLIGLFWSIPAALAQDGVSVLKIAGKAEILDRGRRTEAKEGQFLAPGQSVRLIGGGEVSLSAAGGRIQVRVRDNTTVKYDGEVGSSSQPWISDTRYQRASQGEGKRVPQLSVPVGRLEVEVQPGQEMRVVCPLIMAAVRGTRFTVDVSLDGTSRVDTFEGAVATYGRNGEISLTMPGHSAEVTARQYASFLAGRGVSSPGGNWKNVPPRTQERVDSDSLGTIFREGGGSLLAAVLANPNASPASGVNALAVESSSIETGSLFVEGSLVSGGAAGGSGLASPADSSGVLPDSSLLDQGLPNIQNPYVPHSSGPIAHYIGSFSPSYMIFDVMNFITFDLDLSSGAISNASFDLEYDRSHLSYGTATTALAARGGSGSLDSSTLHFDIGHFASNSFNEWVEDSSMGAPFGTLGSGTTISGSFLGPVNYGQSGDGWLTPDYVLNSSSSPMIDMPSSLQFSGMADQRPMVAVEGTFNIPNLYYLYANEFHFVINLNTGAISGVDMHLSYDDTSSNAIDMKYYNGSGSVDSSGNFNIATNNGYISGAYSYTNPTSQLTGAFSANDPVPGVQVSGGTLSISAGSPPPFFPTSYSIQNGQVVPVQ